MRLVNADDIKYTDMLAPMGNGNYEHVGIVTESEIEALPTVEAAPVVHGKWLWELADNGWADHICSVCGYTENTDIHVWLDWRYCPNCGADMRGKRDGTKHKYVTLHHEDIHFIDEDAERTFYESLAEGKEEIRPYDPIWDMYLDEFEDAERKEE